MNEPGDRMTLTGSPSHFGGATLARVRRSRVGIVVDRRDARGAEQLGEHPHHDLAVLEHVADPRGGAAVVLEHEEVLGAGADEVDADDVAE